MNFLPETKLANYTSMRIGGPAKIIAELNNEQDIIDAVNYARENNLKLLVIGQGSNIIFGDSGFDGLVLVNKIPGLLIDQFSGTVRIGAGTPWHEVVTQTVEAGFIGVEAMAMIPGASGATPVNNVGAYGQEIKDTLVSVRAFDMQTNQFVELQNADCAFGYRTSRFKTTDYGRFIISSITLKLQQKTSNYQAPDYPALQADLIQREIYYPTPEDVMRSIILIRTTKLPDPKRLANAGSFFKNPVITTEKLSELLQSYPTMPHYPMPDGHEKLAAGWLIEQAGLKNQRQNGIWVYERQALVLVNENAQSFADLWAMVTYIQKTIFDIYGVKLEPEPEIFAT